jgi:mycothiol system anti-sigma-R factor
MITCAEAVKQLWDYLDRELPPNDRARVEEHLAFCRKCCGESEFAEELQRFLAEQREEDDIPADVRARLEAMALDISEG